MGRQWARHEIKKNEVADVLTRTTDWIAANPRQVQGAVGGILAVLAIAGMIVWKTFQNRNEAWKNLLIAQTVAYQGHPDVALKQLGDLTSQYPSSAAAGYADLFTGDIQFRMSQYREAAQTYQHLLDRQKPASVMPLALSSLGIAQEAAGDCKSAEETAQRFLDTYADNFLAPQAHAILARCLDRTGDKAKAKATYERMSLLYPDSYWARWAQDRLKS